MLLFICFTVFLIIIYRLNFSSSRTVERVVFTRSQSCISAGLFHSGDRIFARLAENTMRMMFIFLFSVISWMRGWKILSPLQVRIKPKLVYTLTHSSFQNVSHVKYIALFPTISLIAATRSVNCKCIGREAIASSLLQDPSRTDNGQAQWEYVYVFDISSSTVFGFHFCYNKTSLSNISLTIILPKRSP